jgi:hypothetical protein
MNQFKFRNVLTYASIISALTFSPVVSHGKSLYLQFKEDTPLMQTESPDILTRYGVSDIPAQKQALSERYGSDASHVSDGTTSCVSVLASEPVSSSDSLKQKIMTKEYSVPESYASSSVPLRTVSNRPEPLSLEDELYDPLMDDPTSEQLEIATQAEPLKEDVRKVQKKPIDVLAEIQNPIMEITDHVSLGMQASSVINDEDIYTPKLKYFTPNKEGDVLFTFGDIVGAEIKAWAKIYESKKKEFTLSASGRAYHESFDMKMDSGSTDSYSLTGMEVELVGKYEKEIYREWGSLSPIFRKYILEPSLGLGLHHVDIDSDNNPGLEGLIATVKPGIRGQIFIDRENLFKDYQWNDDPCAKANNCDSGDCLDLTENERTSPVPMALLDEQKRLTKFISLGLLFEKEFALGNIDEATYATYLRDLRNEFFTTGVKVGLDGKYDLELRSSFGKYDTQLSAVAHYYWRAQLGEQMMVGRVNLGADDHYGEGFNFFTGVDVKFLRPEVSPFIEFDDPTLRYYAQTSLQAGNRGISLMGKLPLDWTGIYEAMGLTLPNGQPDRNTVIELTGGVELMLPSDAKSMINYMIGVSGSSAKRPPLEY